MYSSLIICNRFIRFTSGVASADVLAAYPFNQILFQEDVLGQDDLIPANLTVVIRGLNLLGHREIWIPFVITI